MAMNNLFKNNFVTALGAALAATVLAPIVVPAVKRSARPLAKGLVRGSMSLYEKSREAVAYAGEAMEDVIAEVRAEEMEKQLAQTHAFGEDGAESMKAAPAPGGNGSAHAGGGKDAAKHEARQSP